MKPNVLLFLRPALPTVPQTRCCTDEPRPISRPTTLRRWSSKLRIAVPASVRVFGGAVREPVQTRVPAGTPVRTPAGRHVGRVREVVVAVPSGRTSYAVDDAQTEDARAVDARVLLIPQAALRTAGAHAVVEERVLEGASS
jgi:hypothetical protein